MIAAIHSHFWEQSLHTLTFFALMMSFLSLWIRKTAWLWGSFLAISFLLAYQTGVAKSFTLIPLSLLGLTHLALQQNFTGLKRLFLILFATGISLCLALHLFPGFSNWKIAENLILGEGAAPYTFYLNFDKPFIGIFILAWSLPLIQTSIDLKKMLKVTIPFTLIGIVILFFLSTSFGMVRFEPKVPTIFLIWMAANLFLVTIPEEAFYRGFIQRELYRYFGEGMRGGILSLLVTSLLFALLHFLWVASWPHLIVVFVASLIYGGIYQYTQSIESSILCHYAVNTIHILFFTYPGLA